MSLIESKDRKGKKYMMHNKYRDNEKRCNGIVLRKPMGFGARHTQVCLLSLTLCVGFIVRSQLSVTLVAMTLTHTSKIPYKCMNNVTDEFINLNETLHIYNNGNQTSDLLDTLQKDDSMMRNKYLCEINKTVPIVEGRLSNDWDVYRTYNWSKSTQELILFAFFTGYTSMMIPAGVINQLLGAKIPILIMLFMNTITCVSMPWMPIFGGWMAVAVCRCLEGLTQATLYPSIHYMLGKWVPVSERGRLSTYVYAGTHFGTVTSFQLAGYFAGSPLLGWPATFWFCGALCFICFVLMACLGHSSPQDHSTISEHELYYITGYGKDGKDNDQKKPKTPWRKMMASKAVWAIVCTQSGCLMAYIFVLTQIPLYMHKVLKIDIKTNGVYSSLPYIFMYLAGITSGFLSDFLVNSEYMSLLTVRRVANSIAAVASPVLLVAFTFVEANDILAVAVLTVAQALHAVSMVGYYINHIDLTPKFAGALMSVSNMSGSLCGLLIPVLVANIVHDTANQQQWQLAMIAVATVKIVGNIVYVLFAKADVQPWNYCEQDNDMEEMVKLKNDNNKVNKL